MKILIYGATFNPVHLAHISSIEYAYKKGDFDKLLIVPNYTGHFKENNGIASVDDRLNMLKLALKKLKIDYELSLIEINQQKKIYTYDLINQLKLIYQDSSFTFLVGSDQAEDFNKWHRFDELNKMIDFMIVKRSKDYKNDNHIVLDNEILDYSSTKIREEYASSGIESVDQYIREHGLYLEQLVSHKIKEKRFNHIKNVARKSQEIAKYYKLDQTKAYIMGMLHDICKEMPLERQYQLVDNRETFEVNDATIHSYAAYYYCLEHLKIKDEIILSAIKKHTCAGFEMGIYDKLLYVCDMLSDEREFEGIEDLRNLLYVDLNECFKQCFIHSFNYLLEKNVKISLDNFKLKEMIERNEV